MRFSTKPSPLLPAATPTEPKSISPTDPAARYTAAADTPAVYAYSDNYLVDLKNAVIMDVEATTAVRQAEVGAANTILDRAAERLDGTPSRLVADAGYRLDLFPQRTSRTIPKATSMSALAAKS